MGGWMNTDYQILEEFHLDVYKLYIYIKIVKEKREGK